MLDKDSKIVVIALTLIILILTVLFIMDRSGSRQDEQQDSYSELYGQTNSVDSYSAVPYDGATVMTTTLDLQWRAGKLATSHTVYLHQNKDWVATGDPNALLTETQDTTVKAVDLSPDSTYYWRVDAVNPKDPNSPWAGQIWHFRIPPNQAFDLFPPDGATGVSPHVRLSWKRPVDAQGYRMAWGTDTDSLANTAGEELTLSTTSFEPNALNPGTTYTWRVDTVTQDSVIAGKIQSFTVLDDTRIAPNDDPNLIGWWQADEPNTSLALLDHSGHGLHAFLQGSASRIEGVSDGAVELDKKSSFRTLKTSNVTLTNATLSAWIRPKEPSTGVQGIIFCRGSSATGLNLTDKNELGYHWNDDQQTWTYQSGLTIPTGQWSFVALVIEPNEARLYLNDLESPAINAISHQPASFDGLMNLGADPGEATRTFFGALDDIRFYDRALTQEELEEIRNE